MAMAQHDEFTQRLQRIHSGKTTAWTVPGEGLATKREEARVQNVKNVTETRKAKGGLGTLIMLPFALVSGVASVVAGRWIAFTYFSEEPMFGFSPTEMLGGFMGDIVFALAISFLFTLIIGVKSKLSWVHTAGFAAALFYEQELVHLVPDLYAQFYSPAWVAGVTSTPSLLAPYISQYLGA